MDIVIEGKHRVGFGVTVGKFVVALLYRLGSNSPCITRADYICE